MPRKKKTVSHLLWYHKGSGQWAKTIKGKRYYFGTDEQAANDAYLEQKDYLLAGRRPPQDALTVEDLCNKFLDYSELQTKTGELSKDSHWRHQKSCERIIACFGWQRVVEDLQAEDFDKLKLELAEQYAVSTLAAETGRIKSIFNFADRRRLIDKPVPMADFGVKAKAVRKHHQQRPDLSFSAREIRQLLQAARKRKHPVRCWLLLMINCGFGVRDLEMLEERHIDGEYIALPRPKTGEDRRCWLWPEARQELARNPISSWGSRHQMKYNCERALESLPKRPGRSIYSLRRTLSTIAQDRSVDVVALDLIFGHASDAMRSLYNQRAVRDARVKAISEAVRDWLLSR